MRSYLELRKLVPSSLFGGRGGPWPRPPGSRGHLVPPIRVPSLRSFMSDRHPECPLSCLLLSEVWPLLTASAAELWQDDTQKLSIL